MKAKVIMLETIEKSKITQNSGGLIQWKENISAKDNLGVGISNVNFYLIDPNTKIKEGDWCIDDKNRLCQCVKDCGEDGEFKYTNSTEAYLKLYCSKILATTDKSLII